MSAYGNDPAFHHIVDGSFVCSAPEDAKCRTFPTCECENWCCCDGSPEDVEDNHDGEHCCMTTVKPGQDCWMKVWVDAVGVEDSGQTDDGVTYGEDGELILRDGPVECEWDDGIGWGYAEVVL